ncbi:MAG: mechanosensitive ion channel [Armatimonadetes bacterium]|nr:mechanosensitive ion channel [Armatimonadota bacterium]NIM24616.1 mechanosensitive ion channel [Armatimonadota bacterium]NIM68492.1 mechanosensitive ion channel [Armatimonadota bacterium]NIM76877.1 mechanosensitive ion channel [Armatimonadota bacterium]NIN06689.1 mechanosensitive ion channel [Armatimonadota bacterium]
MTFKQILMAILEKGPRVALIILLALLIDWLIRRALRKLADRMREQALPGVGPRAVTLVKTAGSLAKYTVFFTAALMILTQLGISPMPVLAGAGIAGLAVGFGAQTLVRDVVSGFFILLEGQYDVGEMVEINGVVGKVESVGLRMTKLKDNRGQTYYFPNGAITSVNAFPEEGSTYMLHIPAEEARTDIVGKAVEVMLEDFNDEYGTFALTSTLVGTKSLSSYANVLLFKLTLHPSRLAVTLEKLPARLKTSLERAGLALPEGTEISMMPELHSDH